MKVCIITGVTREQGLGYAIAKQMFEKGYQVYFGGRHGNHAALLAQQIDGSGNRVKGMSLDVTDDASVASFFSVVQAEQGCLDALINNAGGGFDAGTQPLDINIEEARGAFDINLFGALRMVRRAVPMMRMSSAPSIVNVSSGAGTFADPVFGLAHHPALVPSYALSKLALNGLTVKLANQLKDRGILVNAVDPGLVATYPGMKEMGGADPMEAARGVVWAATLSKGGPSGGLFRDSKMVGW